MAKPDFAHPPRERTAGIGGGAENIAWNLFQCRARGSSLWLAVGIKRGDVQLSNRKCMMQRRHHGPIAKQGQYAAWHHPPRLNL